MTMQDDSKRAAAKARRQAESEDRNGKLTPKGRQHVKIWIRAGALIPDAGAVLDLGGEAYAAFANDPDHGFDLTWTHDFEDVIRSELHLEPGAPLAARVRDDLGGVLPFAPDEAPADVRYIVDSLLPFNAVNMFIALPEALKSWAAFSVAVAISKGLPWGGRFATKAARVAIFDWEVGTDEMRRRLRILGADGRVLCKSFPQRDITDPRFWAELTKLQVRFIVIDSLSRGSGVGVSETDARYAEPLSHAARHIEQRRRAAEEAEESVEDAACSVLIIHHAGKNASLSDVEGLFRGTGALRGGVDSAFYFQRVTAPDGEDRAKVISVKCRKGVKPAPFLIRFTDQRGIEVIDETKPRKVATAGDDGRVLAAIEKSPSGISATAVSKVLSIRKADVLASVKRLTALGRARTEGKGRAAAIFAVPQSVPSSTFGTD